MKRIIHHLATAALLLFACRLDAAVAADAAPTAAQIKSAIHRRVARLGPEAAIVFGWVDESGVRVIAAGKGPGGKPPGGDTVFEIGSVSKTFTCTLLADMVKKGEVSLDDLVAKYLPASVRVPARGGREIKLADLATHTSGLPRLPDNLDPKDDDNPYADYTVDQLYAFLSGYSLPRDVGAKFEYSNLGMGLLGHALALKAGTDYDALVNRRICTPLGMSDTHVALTDGMKSRLVPGHTAKGREVENWDIPTLAGCGGLRSTADDLLKYVSANLGLTPSDLTPAMYLAHAPRHAADSNVSSVGLAWHTYSRTGGPIIWHNGETGGYHSFVAFDKARKRGVVILTNFASDIDNIGLNLLSPAGKAMHVATRLAPKLLDAFVGKYRFADGDELTVRRDGGQVQAQITGQDFLPVFPESETDAFYKAVNAQLTFKKNAKGEVTSVVLHQAGFDQEAKRE